MSCLLYGNLLCHSVARECGVFRRPFLVGTVDIHSKYEL